MIGFYESVCFLLMKCVSITWTGGDQESLTLTVVIHQTAFQTWLLLP